MAMLVLFSQCNFSVTTAHITNVKICAQIYNNRCESDNPDFSTETPEINVTCTLKNAPENTRVKISWYYLGQKKINIDEVVLNSGNNSKPLDLHSSLSKPNNGWPKGEYEVAIEIVDAHNEPVVRRFNVQ